MGSLLNLVLVVLAVGFAFVLVGSIINDFETYYSVDVNTSWSSEYDYSKKINESVYGVQKDIEELEEEDKGWFISGIVAITHAAIAFSAMIITTLGYGIKVLSGVINELGFIPVEIIPFAIIAFIVGVIFTIVSFWRKYKE